MMNQYMEQLCRDLELPETIAHELAGVYTVPLDEETAVQVIDIPPGFSLVCPFSSTPEHDLERFYIYLLSGNLLGQATEGSVLGMTEDGKELVLHYLEEKGVTYNRFVDILEEFFNACEFWREETILHKKGKLPLS